LNEVQDSIVALRERKASYATIRAMLHENAGIEVSHQTVARYCREVLDSAKPKKSRRPKTPAAHHNFLPKEPEFLEKLNLFESLLLNYLTPCTAAQQRELLELMAGQPDDEKFARVNKLILHKTANLHFFFDKLENPIWLPFLDKKGVFENLPGPEPTEDGRLMYRHHLPLMILTRLAGTASQAVSDVLIKLRLPDNPYVGDQILQCMAKISDPNCIKQLRPVITQLGENPMRSSWQAEHKEIGR
jgi:hypothetical protein